MNKSFRLIWNNAKQLWIIAAEIIKGNGGPPPVKGAVVTAATMMVLTGAMGSSAATLPQSALPTGGQVAAGQAVISQSGTRMNINQSTQSAILNWQTFNIGAQSLVNFTQPNSTSTALNRVLTTDPSQIYGSLSATGRVFLINPAGVLFGPSSSVNVGGLVASTMDIADNDFMARRYTFNRNGSTGSIITQGTITVAEGGFAALLAPEVRNEGIITARMGSVALAAGEKVTLNFNGSNLLGVSVDPATIATLIENKHLIQAEGGQVVMAASAANKLYGSTINNSGTVSATSLVNMGGVIKLVGDTINVTSGSVIEAKGATGGGTILIGGEAHGSGTTPHAQTVTVESGAAIDASATQTGAGGRVVVWSDTATNMYGAIVARGGLQGGDGGWVETSGPTLNLSGTVDAGSNSGAHGYWLLDPNDLTITSSGSSVTGGTAYQPGTTGTILNTSINSALNAGSNVTIATSAAGTGGSGNITVSAAITATTNASATTAANSPTLLLQADNDITIGAGIDVRANVQLKAGRNITDTGGYTLKTYGQDVVFNSRANNATYGTIDVESATIQTNGGNISMYGGTAVGGYAVGGSWGLYTSSDTINAGGGNILMAGQSLTGNYYGGLRIGYDSIVTSGSGTITLKGDATLGNSGNHGTGLYLGASSITTGSGALSITGTTNGWYGNPAGTSIVQNGIFIEANVGALNITSSGGNITLTGTNSSTSGYAQAGIQLMYGNSSTTISTTGTGSVTINGTGGSGYYYYGPNGAIVFGSNYYGSNPASTWNYNPPVYISTVAGDININATSGGSTALYIYSSASKIYSTSGNITITATNPGTTIATPSGSQIGYNSGAGTTGNITLIADNLASFYSTVKGTGTLTFQPASTSASIGLGGSSGYTLNIPSSWLTGGSYFTTGFSSFVVGRGDSTGGITVNSSLSNVTGSLSLLEGTGAITISNAISLYNGITNGYNLTLQSRGSVTQSAAFTNVAGLELLGTGGSFTLQNAGNSFAKLAAATGSLKLVNSRSLLIDEVGGTAGVTTTVATNWTDIAVTGASSDLQVNAPIVTVNSLDLAVGRNYLNYYGSNALTASRWLVYSASPVGDIFNAQDSTNAAVWSKTSAGYAPAAVTETGNRYLFASASAPLAVVFSKMYDGLATVTGTASVDNAVFGMAVTFTGSAATADKNVGSGKALTSNSLALTAGSPLYTLTGATVTITPRPLALTATYNGLTAVTSGATVTNLVSGDAANTVVLSGTGWMANRNAGTSKVYSSGTLTLSGSNAANYTVNNGRITINPLAVTLSGSRVYDGTATAAAAVVTVTNAIGSDVVTLSGSGTLASRNSGAESISSMTGLTLTGAAAANYTLSGATGSVTIAKAPLILSAIPDAKTYDGLLTAAATPVISGSVGTGDTLSVSEAYATVGVASGKTLTVSYSLSDGNSGNNYTVTTISNSNGQIFKAPLTITLTPNGATRVYDSTTTTNNSAFTTSMLAAYSPVGLVNSETANGIGLTLSGLLAFNGSTSTVIKGVGSYSPDRGTLAFTESSGNYAITTNFVNASNNQYVITKAPLTISGTRVYDGTTNAFAANLSISSGKYSSDTVTLTGATTVADKNVGSNKTLTSVTGITLAGADAGNYVVTGGTLSITAQTITLTAQANTKYYDGTTAAAATPVVSGMVFAGDTLAANETYTSTTAGTGKTLAVNYSLSDGNSGGNYIVNLTNNTSSVINKGSLTISLIPNRVTKVYDGTTLNTTTFSQDLSNYTITGIASGQTATSIGLTISGSMAFNGSTSTVVKNAGTYGMSSGTLSLSELTNNYSVSFDNTVGNQYVITKAPLTVSGTRVYDATATVASTALTTFSGLIGQDSVSMYGGNGTLSSKAVGTNRSVTLGTLAIGGTDGGNYSLTGATLTVTPATVTVTGLSAANKVYNQSATATLSGGTLSGVISGDTVTLSLGTATFADNNAGNGKSVTVTGTTIGGTDQSNYILVAPTGLTANITPKALTITGVTTSDKVYDGTTVAALSGGTISGVISGDTVTVGAATGSFADANAASGKAVTVKGFALSGLDATNYSLTLPTSLTATITPAPLTMTAVSDAIVYGDTQPATFAVKYSGFVNGENASTLSGAVVMRTSSSIDAGVYSGDLVPYGTAQNYTITKVSADYTIYQAGTLLIKADSTSRVYGAADPTFTYTVGGLKNGNSAAQVVSAATVTPSSTSTSGVGNYTLTPSAVNLTTLGSTNYDINQVVYFTGNYSIIPKNLTVTAASGVTKTYDGTTNLPGSGYTVSGIVGSDAVSVGGTGAFSGKNVGTGISFTVSDLSLTGAGAANYALATSSVSGSGTITAKTLGVSNVTVADKVYDGARTATVSGGDLSGLIAGDTVTFSLGSATFADKNVANNKAVTVTGTTISGMNSGNYLISNPSGLTASITPAALTITGVTAADKVYNRSTAATISGGALSGKVSGDTVTLTLGTASFADWNVGSNKAVTVAGSTIGGSDAGNYTVTNPAGLTASITPFALTATGVTAGNKVYDQTATATIQAGGSLNTFSGDTVTITGGSGNFADKNVANGKTVTITGLTLSGSAAGNYTVNIPTGITADITPLTLTATTLVTTNKVYDGTRTATFTGGVMDGIYSGDVVTLALGAANFDTKNVGDNKAVTLSSAGLAGYDAGNYTLTTPTVTAASITKAPLTVSLSASNKVYDGTDTASATLRITSGLVGSETVTASGSATFNSKNVLTANLVTVNSTALADGSNGGLASNYSLAAGQTVAAAITPASLTATVAAPNKVYDGTTAATPTLTITGGLVGSEIVTATGSATFNSRNVLDANLVTVNSVALANGSGGGLASNYTLSAGETVAASITTKGLTVTGLSAANKMYDGTTSAVVSGGALQGIVGSDTVNLVQGAATFASKNVGTGLMVTAVASSLTGTDAGNYTVSAATSFTASITKAPLTLTTSSDSKPYDGTVTSAGNVLVSGSKATNDTVTVAQVFDSKNAGSRSLVITPATYTIVDTLGNNMADNYAISTVTTTGSISTAPITITVANVTKTYDGGTSAISTPVVSSGTLFTGDSISGTIAFADKNVGIGTKTVAISNVTVGDGITNSNYAVTLVDNTTSTIRPYAVNLTGSRVYDGTASVASGIFTMGTLVGSETLTLTGSGTLENKNVGSGKGVAIATLSLGNGTLGGLAANYTLTGGTLTATITAAPLTISTGNVTKTYDGGLSAAGSATTTVGTLYSGDTLVGGSFAFTDKNAGSGNKTVTVGGVTVNDGNGGANYSVTFAPNTTSSISPKLLTSTFTGEVSKVYDGVTGADLSSGITWNVIGAVAGETVALTAAAPTSGSYAGSNVGYGQVVSANISGSTFSYTNAAAGNYTVPTTSTGFGDITPRAITVTANDRNKTYGSSLTLGSSAFAIGGAGMATGQDISAVTLTSAGAAATAHRADGDLGMGLYALTASGATGTFTSSNYTISYVPGTLTVAPKALTATVASTSSTYGTLAGTGAVTLTGKVTGDALATMVGTFTDAGLGTPVTLSATTNAGAYTQSVTALTGVRASDYSLALSDITAGTLTINPKQLTASISGTADKVYDGTTAISLTGAGYTLFGLVGSESFTVSNTPLTGTLSLKDAGVRTVTVDLTAATFTAGNNALTTNYLLPVATGSATVTPRPITITAGDGSKSYGAAYSGVGSGQTSFTVGGSGMAVVDSVSETIDSVTLASAGAAASAHRAKPNRENFGPKLTKTPNQLFSYFEPAVSYF